MAVIPRPEYSLKGFDIARESFFRARALLTHAAETKGVRLGLLVTANQDLGFADWGLFTLKDLEERGLISSPRYLSQGVMRDLYSSVDAVVIASRAENLPNVAVEAIRDRCPVIATDVGGVGEVFTEGQIGQLVASESITELAEAMVEVAVKRGREWYNDALGRVWNSAFSPSVVSAGIESVMAEAIARRGTGLKSLGSVESR